MSMLGSSLPICYWCGHEAFYHVEDEEGWFVCEARQCECQEYYPLLEGETPPSSPRSDD